MSGVVVWLTGRPQSGKSTLAGRVAAAIESGRCVLDSDEVRRQLWPELGYSPDDRDRFYERLASLAGYLAAQGLVVIVAATAGRASYRERARQRCDDYVEVYVSTPTDECARRDGKGLYSGDVSQLPGRGAPFEEPTAADVVASGGHDDAALAAIVDALRSRGVAAGTPARTGS